LWCLSWNITRGGDEPREKKKKKTKQAKENQKQMQFIKAKGDNMHECNMMR
jgi:hypothetical protein